MGEYNFEPDYDYWWNKEDLTPEELSILVFGVNPDAFFKYIEVFPPQTRTDDDGRYIKSFDDFLNEQSDIVISSSILSHSSDFLINEKYWEGDKHSFVRSLYETSVAINIGLGCHLPEMHPSFLKYLESLGECPTHFDHYKDHSDYGLDFSTFDFTSINSEDDAIAVLLGLKPKFFNKFMSLLVRGEQGQYKGEDLFFKNEYRKFLHKRFFSKHAWCNVHGLYSRLKQEALWDTDFSIFVQSAIGKGYIITDEVKQCLQERGIDCSYSTSSSAISFYKFWVSKPLWTLDEAAKLYLAQDPNDKFIFYGIDRLREVDDGYHYHLINYKNILLCDEHGDWIKPVNSKTNEETSLSGLVSDYVRAYAPEWAVDCGGGSYKYKPDGIVKFFKDKFTLTSQPEALFVALGMAEQSSNKGDARTHTGMAGRPSSKHLYIDEMEARASRGELSERVSYEAKYLMDWLKIRHPDLNCGKQRSIENSIRERFRQLKTA